MQFFSSFPSPIVELIPALIPDLTPEVQLFEGFISGLLSWQLLCFYVLGNLSIFTILKAFRELGCILLFY
jgi:hypothetical protein